MPKSLKFFAVAFVAAGLFVASAALAANLSYTADTNIALTSPAITLTIASGSTATALEVGTGSITVTVPVGGHFTVTSASRALSASAASLGSAIVESCSGGEQTTTITPVGVAETITLNPQSAQCTAITTNTGNANAGGGGGGSGAPASTPTPTPTPASGAASFSAPAGAHSNGTLVIDGNTVYLIANGKRVAFRDANEYKSHGYNWGQLVAANATDKSLAVDTVQKALEGTLALDASDNKTVYMIGPNNTKRGFTSEAVFKQLGYTYKGLLKINLSDYTTGAVISSATAAHPEGSLVMEGKTVWWIRNGTRSGFESEAVFKTYGFSFDRTVRANAADLAIPTSSAVKFRDGTLVIQNGAIYLISDGKKLVFSSMNALTSRGYKASNAISANVSSYASGGDLR